MEYKNMTEKEILRQQLELLAEYTKYLLIKRKSLEAAEISKAMAILYDRIAGSDENYIPLSHESRALTAE